MRKKYSEAFQLKAIGRLAGSSAISASMLAREIGVSEATLSRWKTRWCSVTSDLASQGLVMTGTISHLRPNDKPASEKFRIVCEARGLDDSALGEFLRKEGIHKAQLDEWTQEVLQALSANPKLSRTSHKNAEQRKVKDLEAELERKDKALAEAAVLLMLKKKHPRLWGDGE